MGNNILEFFVKMKDLTSGTLVKFAKNVKQTFVPVQSEIDKTIRKNNELADSFDKVERKASSSGSSIGKYARNIGMAVSAGAIIAGAGAFMKSSAEAYIRHEGVSKSFEVLAGNKGIGNAVAGELNSLQQNTILGPEVFKNAQTMMGFGIGAEKVIPHLKMLGDISMGDANKLQSLTLAFSQVQAAGKLTGQDLLQMINAGFNPLNEISKQTGKSIGVLKKEMEDGSISANQVTKAFEAATGKGGLFNGMMDQMAQTSAGKIAQLEGGVESLKIALGERLKPAINFVVDSASKMVAKIKSWVEIPLEKKLGDQINKIQALHAEMTASNTSHQRQVEILKELEAINPKIVEGINAQNIEYSKLAGNINNVTGALRQKIFMEKFDKQNVDVLTDYAEAQNKRNESFAEVMSIVGGFSDIAQNNKMTLGQKQVEAKKRLESLVAADPEKGWRKARHDGQLITVPSEDRDRLNRLTNMVAGHNSADKVIANLQPTINDINKTKDSIGKQIDSFLGVGSMTAANIQGGNKGGGSAAGSTPGKKEKDVAGGITGGGPRVININGVKFTDKVEINATTIEGGIQQTEKLLEEMYLRILNSGASVE